MNKEKERIRFEWLNKHIQLYKDVRGQTWKQLARVYLSLNVFSLVGTIEYLQVSEPWLSLYYVLVYIM